MKALSGIASARPLEFVFLLLVLAIAFGVAFGVDFVVSGLAPILVGFLGAVAVFIGALLWSRSRWLFGTISFAIGFALWGALAAGWVAV